MVWLGDMMLSVKLLSLISRTRAGVVRLASKLLDALVVTSGEMRLMGRLMPVEEGITTSSRVLNVNVTHSLALLHAVKEVINTSSASANPFFIDASFEF